MEFRAAAFLPTGKLFRHIYGDVGTSYQLEVSDDICTPIQGWVNFDLIHERGQVKYCGRSKVRIYNLSFGPRLLHPLTSRSAVYLGVGLGVTRIFVRNHGCESHWKSQYTLGGVLKSGIHLYFYPQLVLDLFGDYLYQHVHLHRKADIGGFKLGGGIGWQF